MSWLEQKLAQNGFTLQDLASQTGLSLQQVSSLAQSQRGTSPEWDIVLSVLNDYPSVRIPDASILDEISSDIDSYPDGQAQLFYGISDGAITFCGYLCLDDSQYHGASVDRTYLSSLTTSLDDALTLFTRQNAASNYSAE